MKISKQCGRSGRKLINFKILKIIDHSRWKAFIGWILGRAFERVDGGEDTYFKTTEHNT